MATRTGRASPYGATFTPLDPNASNEVRREAETPAGAIARGFRALRDRNWTLAEAHGDQRCLGLALRLKRDLGTDLIEHSSGSMLKKIAQLIDQGAGVVGYSIYALISATLARVTYSAGEKVNIKLPGIALEYTALAAGYLAYATLFLGGAATAAGIALAVAGVSIATFSAWGPFAVMYLINDNRRLRRRVAEVEEPQVAEAAEVRTSRRQSRASLVPSTSSSERVFEDFGGVSRVAARRDSFSNDEDPLVVGPTDAADIEAEFPRAAAAAAAPARAATSTNMNMNDGFAVQR